MKKIALAMCLLILMAGIASAEIVSTRDETKVAGNVRQIANILGDTEQNIILEYNRAKTYVLAHPAQFDSADKTKLTALEAELIALRTEVLSTINYIETEFPGISE